MPGRRGKPLVLVEEFAPDHARCAQALIRLLSWESPADASETTQDLACGDGPQAEQTEPDDAP